MGAHCSIHNDTLDETVMIYVGVNTKVLEPILWSITGMATLLSGGVALGSVPATFSVAVTSELALTVGVSSLTAAAGGLVSASNFILDKLQTQLVTDLTKGGYHKCLPGQTYTTPKVSPGLNLRAWAVRIQRTSSAIIIKRASASVWSGTQPGSQKVYRVLDKTVFKRWAKYETIPLLQQEGLPKEILADEAMTTTFVEDKMDEPEEEKKCEDGEATQEDSRMPATTGHDRDSDDLQNADVAALIIPEDDPFTFLDSGMVKCTCKLVEITGGELGDEKDEEDSPNDNASEAWVQIDTIAS